MLPEGFTWKSLSTSRDREVVLAFEGTEVARLWQKVDGPAWFITLDQHLPYECRRDRPCSSYEQGRLGAEMWAERHQDRIREVCRRRWESYLASQTWRAR